MEPHIGYADAISLSSPNMTHEWDAPALHLSYAGMGDGAEEGITWEEVEAQNGDRSRGDRMMPPNKRRRVGDEEEGEGQDDTTFLLDR